MNLLGLAASTLGLVLAVSPLLQARRIHICKASTDVSLPFWLIVTAGNLMWALYAASISDLYLFIPNAVCVATSTFTVALVCRYRTHDHDQGTVQKHGHGASRNQPGISEY